ncbi:MAG: cytochrome c oxidase subunit 3 [Acidobacteriia bacterium]|nr:cytochrome c oxidase subunit 3 [Terriglobia bacterium]
MALLSDRAGKTSRVVVLPASLEDPSKSPPGMYRLGLLIACGSILAFFVALVFAFYWRSRTPPFWAPVTLPQTLWLSTAIILASSGTFEAARRAYRRGQHPAAARLLVVTACLGAAFLASQLSAWLNLVHRGYYLAQNPYSSFFYMFTGLHAAHLIGGLIALFIVVLGRPRRETVDTVAFYWHFLGVLWVALFVILLIS